LINTTETVRDIEVPEGRRLLHEFYHERRLKHTLEFRTLMDCWRFSVKAREIQFDDGRRVSFETRLGAKLGTRVFLEEIVGTYYYNFIQGLVYAGAMLVLVAVAMYLAGAPVTVAVAGFAIEAGLLLVFALVTAYSPIEDYRGSSHSASTSDTVFTALNDNVRDMTNAISDLFRLVSQTDIRQDVLLTRLSEFLSKSSADSTRIQVEKLDEIHKTLKTFTEEIALNQHKMREEYLKFTQETEQTVQRLQEYSTPIENAVSGSDQEQETDTNKSDTENTQPQAGTSALLDDD
jgi:hypothetical protein